MKKILCLFAVLLLVCSSFASEREDFFYYIQKSSVDFKLKQTEYYKNSLNQSDTEREKAFLQLYVSYIKYYNDINEYYKANIGASFDTEYVKKQKDEYLKSGLGFNIPEWNWQIEEDYSMLLNTPGIPQTWAEWLNLQQKYVEKNRKTCIHQFLKYSRSCEGGTMTIHEREQAIVDLSRIEQKSDVISSIKSQDFDYIPYTSKELMFTYLIGNDLKPIFLQDKDGKIKLEKDSRKSFEHFIKHHKDSVYFDMINEYYKSLKQNNFIYSEDIITQVINKLNGY